MTKNKKELNNNDLNNVSGGKTNLDKYLKDLSVKDKTKIIVDKGNGDELVLSQSVQYPKDANLDIIIEREKDSPIIDAELYIKNE